MKFLYQLKTPKTTKGEILIKKNKKNTLEY